MIYGYVELENENIHLIELTGMLWISLIYLWFMGCILFLANPYLQWTCVRDLVDV